MPSDAYRAYHFVSAWVSSWGALDYASCDATAGHWRALMRSPSRAGSEGVGPVISIRRVAHSLRTASAIVVQRLFRALLFSAQKLRRAEQKCAEKSLDHYTRERACRWQCEAQRWSMGGAVPRPVTRELPQ